MKRTLFAFFSLWLAVCLLAENIPVEKAQSMAAGFFQSNLSTRVSTSDMRLVWDGETAATRTEGSAPAYYVFNNPSGRGFVIVAGDDIAMPILGYSFKNNFEPENMPANLKGWMEGLRKQINEARRNGVTRSAGMEEQWAVTRAGTTVVELETAQWDQSEPYNALCPLINNQKTYTGCTATALAIIMRYHEWPAHGTGTLPGYTTESYSISVPAQPLGHAYEWQNMPLTYGRSYTSAQGNAVATLMRDCAFLLQSDFGPYGSWGTSASVVDVVPGLVKYMDYDKDATCTARYYYSDNEWHRMLKAEIKAQRPVFYTGSNEEGGHAFVLDGYTTDNYFSVNWGWGGYCNGYYLLSALEPEEQGAGGSGSYNEYQWAVFGLRKNEGGEYPEILRLSLGYDDDENPAYNGFSTTATSFAKDKPFDLSVGFIGNQGGSTFNGKIKLALADKNGVIKPGGTLIYKGYPIEYNKELGVWYGYNWDFEEVTIPIDIAPGDRIRVFYQSSRTPEWTTVYGNEDSDCVWELVLSPAELSIEESTSLSYSKLDKVLRLNVQEGVTVQLFSADGGDLSTLVQGGTTDFSIDTSGLNGVYTLKLSKGEESKEVKLSLGSPEE